MHPDCCICIGISGVECGGISGADRGMMNVEEAYFNQEGNYEGSGEESWLCTMDTNKHLQGGKSLENCLQHYCGRSVGKDAHDAMVATQACMDVFFAMQERRAAA